MGSEHGFALRDGEREDACHAAVRRFEPPRECFVVNQAGELEDEVVLDRQASKVDRHPSDHIGTYVRFLLAAGDASIRTSLVEPGYSGGGAGCC